MLRIGLLGVCVVMAGCADLDQSAHDELSARGYTQIQLDGSGGSYSWTGTRVSDGHLCEGGINVSKNQGVFSSSSSTTVMESCRPAPGILELALPKAAKLTAQKTAMRCDGGKADACSDLGYVYEKGKSGLEIDLAKALALYDRACEMGSGMGCTNAAIAHKQGRGTEINEPKGHGFNVKACELGYDKGCRFQGIDYYQGTGTGIDKGKALNSFKRGCDLGDGWSCSNTAVMLSKGEGAPRDRMAVNYAEKGCGLKSAESCAVYGGYLWRGEGVKRDRTRARELVKSACAEGSELGCERAKTYGS